MSKIKKIVLSAMLLALLIILSRFVSIKTEILVISLSFIPIMMSAIWLGYKYSMLIALLGDFIGAVLFPFGPYFPGFTLSATISGAIYGLFLHNKGNQLEDKKLIIRLLLSSILVLLFINIFLTSFWIHILYGKAYVSVMTSRIVTQFVMLPIQVITIYIIEKFTRPLINTYILNNNEKENEFNDWNKKFKLYV